MLSYEQLGYEPDSTLAARQIKELAETMNPFRIKTFPEKRENDEEEKPRIVRLPLTPKQEELRKLVEQWKRSGPNLRKLINERPELGSMTQGGVTTFWPTDSGRGHLEWNAKPTQNTEINPLSEAVQDFMNLITNPMWERLGGPCARCGDYYWKERRNHTTYCGRKCSSLATAISATKRARQRTHEAKIKIAQAAIEKWDKHHRGNWKRWVERQTRDGRTHKGCSVHWLTRWVHKGALVPPQIG